MKLSDLRKQIEELDAKATKGPWHWVDAETDEVIDYEKRYDDVVEEYQDTHVLGVSLRTVWEKPFYDTSLPKFLAEAESISKADAKLIALSRTAMPELLRRLLVAEEALAAIYCAADDSEDPSDNPVAKAYSKALDVIISKADIALATIRGEEE